MYMTNSVTLPFLNPREDEHGQRCVLFFTTTLAPYMPVLQRNRERGMAMADPSRMTTPTAPSHAYPRTRRIQRDKTTHPMAPSTPRRRNIISDISGNWVSDLQQFLHTRFFSEVCFVLYYCSISVQLVLCDLHSHVLYTFLQQAVLQKVSNRIRQTGRGCEISGRFFSVHTERILVELTRSVQTHFCDARVLLLPKFQVCVLTRLYCTHLPEGLLSVSVLESIARAS